VAEVVSIAQADQFPSGKTQFACGFYACWMAASMAPVGKAPTLTPAEITQKAEASYAAYDGSNDISNSDGMSADQEYKLLEQIGLHYQATATDVTTIRQWIADGYPVIITIAEASVIDRALGRNPYPWNPAGNHVIVLTGVSANDFLVRDSANCTDLYNPNSLRPGPRTYDTAALVIGLATVVVPPWKPRPASSVPPKEVPVPVPTNWKDNPTTKTLTAPNSIVVTNDMRQKILDEADWNAANVPMENAVSVSGVLLHNTKPGEGLRQCFRDKLLWQTASQGVVDEPQMGNEVHSCYVLIAAQQTQIAALQAQLKAAQSNPTGVNVADVEVQIKEVETALDQIEKDLGETGG